MTHEPSKTAQLDSGAANSNPRIDRESMSKSVCETVNVSHQFTIKGYSLAKGMGAEKYIASDTFKVAGYDWAIYFYPDGKNPEDSSLYVSVFIALASEGTDVRVLFELTLVDQSGKGKHKVHNHFDRALESGPYTVKYRGSMWTCVEGPKQYTVHVPSSEGFVILASRVSLPQASWLSDCEEELEEEAHQPPDLSNLSLLIFRISSGG